MTSRARIEGRTERRARRRAIAPRALPAQLAAPGADRSAQRRAVAPRTPLPARLLAASLFACAVAPAPAALAAGVATAREIYDQGAAAYRRGEYAAAAELFARADEIAPNAVALEAALRAALRADEPVLGIELAERAEERLEARSRERGDARSKERMNERARAREREADGRGASLLAAAGAARDAFASRVGRIEASCRGCTARIDGASVPPGRPRWVEAGFHLVQLGSSGRIERRLVNVEPGTLVRVELARPPKPAVAASSEPSPVAAAPPRASDSSQEPPAAPEGRGLSPAWFWGGTAVTGALAVATALSAVDTAMKYSAFVAEPTRYAASAGQAAEARTFVLLGVTAGAGIATAILGIAGVRWHRADPAVTGSLHPGGASLRFHTSF